MKPVEPWFLSFGSMTRLEAQEVDDIAQYIKNADVELIQLSCLVPRCAGMDQR